MLKKAGVGNLRHLREFRGEPGELEVGAEVKVDAVFEKGQTVKVSGVSKGKGFAGTIKRHNFHRGPVSHGSHNVRAPGSIGASADPARVFKGIRGPGQMGNKRATQRGLEVVDVRADENLLLVRGSVPGPKGTRRRDQEATPDGRPAGTVHRQEAGQARRSTRPCSASASTARSCTRPCAPSWPRAAAAPPPPRRAARSR